MKKRNFSEITMLSVVLLNSISPIGNVYANTFESSSSPKTSASIKTTQTPEKNGEASETKP